MAQVKKWYALYTRPRWEKKVHNLLKNSGFESYCPLNRVTKQWSDRVKVVEEPLFRSYVFVQALPEEQTKVRMVDGVVNFVYWLGKPAIIKDKEIENIQRFLCEYEDVEVTPLAVQEGDKVVVTTGVMMDKVGVIKKITKHKVELVIEHLGYKLTASLPKSKVKKVKTI